MVVNIVKRGVEFVVANAIANIVPAGDNFVGPTPGMTCFGGTHSVDDPIAICLYR